MTDTPSPRTIHRALPVAAAVSVVLALAWSGVLDRPSEAYLDAALLGAGAVYATARAINGLVSVLQGTEFSIPMLSFAVGEFLDPVNDLVERFSAMMMVALGSLALQKVLLTLVTDRLFNALLTVVGVAAAAASAAGPAALRRGLLLAFTVLAAARLALVLAMLAAGWTDQLFLAGEERARHAQMQDFRGELEQVGRRAGVSLEGDAGGEESGFGDRLRSVFGPGDEARQRERLAAATAQLLEHWPRAAPPQPPPFARRASSIEADACGAISGCGVQDTFFAAYRAEPHKVETPPGAEKKRKRRLEEVTTDVQRLDLAEQSTDMDAAAAARLVATAEAEITEGDDLLEGGAMVENAPCGEAAALKFHAACVRLEGVRCAAQHLPAPLKRTAASELAYARRAAKTHAPLLENCVVERALYDARDADLRTISRQASAASDRPPQALFRRVDSLAELDASGRNRAQGCLDVLCALDVGVELPFAAVDAADERLRHGAAASSGAPCAVGDKYVVDDELLGRGSYGVVRRCTRKSDGGQFACKTIRLRGGACWDRLHAEISAARKLDHPHICRLHEVFYEKQRVHLIFDLCTGGELWAFLTAVSPHGRRPRPLDEATAQRFAREMLSAVSYMHARGVCHRDLKPQNWLLASAAPGAASRDWWIMSTTS